MVFQCVIRSCKTKSIKDCIMHRWPRNHEMLLKWTNAIRMFQPDFTPTTHTKICSSHFIESDYNLSFTGKKMLKKEAVPSVFKLEVCKKLFNVEMVEVFDDEEGRNLLEMPIDEEDIKKSDLCKMVVTETGDEVVPNEPSTSHSFITPPKPKKRKTYVGDFKSVEELESPNSRLKYWHASKKMVEVFDDEEGRNLLEMPNEEDIKKSDLCKMVVTETGDEVVPNELSTSHSFITPPKPKKRKTYVGDFKSVEELESPNSRLKYWLASKKTITTQQRKIKNLRQQNYRLNQKIKNLDQLIDHLKDEKKINENCFSLLKLLLCVKWLG
ncbi:uncharacterized protein LOC126845113 isoform X3 [Adelges cooleyi]|uniref:uncharacterized protein LOC126845113 isoform X3 n=2 Tax=Adelges cooleyi TaxID=133065 RepID=UPI00217F8C59|nr:uncharacterized protein LOC126845113 isoform X3 [Adelges cooleyi]